tara:strand:+ start:114 stop:398 length:285 start_codon:yes stop_codon:yes gene_type:complete
MLISSCSSSIVDESGTTDISSSSTSVFTQLPSITTVVEIEIPSELDFVALTTDGELVSGSDLWLKTDTSQSGDSSLESENGFAQDMLLWFWAPN